MQAHTTITPMELHQKMLAEGGCELLDVSTPNEFELAHVPGSTLAPLETLDAAAFLRSRGENPKPLYFICASGGRALMALEKFLKAGCNNAVLVEGGVEAWGRSGLPVKYGKSSVIPLMRQVQIFIGIISAIGAILALMVSPWFALISLFIGCALMIAGITGTCALAVFLAKFPWNKTPPASSSPTSCCRLKKKAD